MSVIQRVPATPRQIAANRRNSLKSTGPRTGAGKCRVSLNRLKHGRYARPDTLLREYLVRLGFDPGELERLHHDLIETWQPRDITEAMLVRDLAGLYWDKIRIQRGRATQRIGEVEQAMREREGRELRELRDELPLDNSEIRVMGYRRANECNEKFEEAQRLLSLLEHYVEQREWSEKTKDCLTLLYGKYPNRLSQKIIDLIGLFTSAKLDAPAEEAAYNELKPLLAEERSLLNRESELFRRKRENREANREQEALRQAQGQLTLKGKWEASLDHQVEAKVKLLLRLKLRRSRDLEGEPKVQQGTSKVQAAAARRGHGEAQKG